MTAEIRLAAAHPDDDPGIELRFVSSCVAESKDQDRAELVRDGDGWIAVLCDGTSQSMRSAEAAAIVTADPLALWSERGIAGVTARLREERTLLIDGAKGEEPDPTSFLSRAFSQILRDARERAFQTTLVTVRVTPAESGRLLVEAKCIGDSALLIFDRERRFVRSNLAIADAQSGFGHASPITEVLPDHFRSDELTLRQEVDAGAHIVLCSDGFYDAFATPGELLEWLLEHVDELRDERGQALVDALHQRLEARAGDDDLSFIWLSPSARAAPELEAPPAAVMPSALPKPWIRRLVRALVRWLNRPLRLRGESPS